MIHIFAPLYSLIVAALIGSELRQFRWGQVIFKPLAALSFCLLAVWSGAFLNTYGHLIFTALVFCAIGDVALLVRGNERIFQIGMAAFGLGHFIYVIAFVRLGLNPVWAGSALFGMGLISLVFLRYLAPHLSKEMRWPVRVYVMIITSMVAAALGTQNGLLITAAVMFAVSDMFVARDRFVSENPSHAIAISPLYFGAQALFAMSIALV